MKYTNKLNLPLPIYEAIVNSGYTSGQSDITATGLLEPSKMWALKQQHSDTLIEDVSDNIFSLQGQSIHSILEKAGRKLGPDYVVEERFYTTIKLADKSEKKIGAQIDVVHVPSGLLQDYKVTSVYQVKGELKEDYAKQTNIQAELLRQAGYKVNKLQIVAILRDWSKMEAARNPDYPQHQVVLLDVPMIEASTVKQFIQERSEEHFRNLACKSQSNMSTCSKEDRWAKGDVYAITKQGATRATRLCDTKQAAEMVLDTLGKGYYIEFREGESTRCKFYCPVRSVCEQAKQLMVSKTNKENK